MPTRTVSELEALIDQLSPGDQLRLLEDLIHRVRARVAADGEPESWARGEAMRTGETYALCRCGKSGRTPFCDGTHSRTSFIGTETAPRAIAPEAVEWTEGPELSLADRPCLCSIARYCHRHGDAWALTEASKDPVAKRVAIESAANCPSGRITAFDERGGRAAPLAAFCGEVFGSKKEDRKT